MQTAFKNFPNTFLFYFCGWGMFQFNWRLQTNKKTVNQVNKIRAIIQLQLMNIKTIHSHLRP